jgi:hypothetical protein
MENEAANRRSRAFEVNLQGKQLDECLDGPEELSDDYAQWLDQRRFDDEEQIDP